MDGNRPERIEMIELSRLVEGPNTRKFFDSAKLAELAEDIRAHDVQSPLLVRPIGDDDTSGHPCEIVCGARRYRAASLAGLVSVPCIVRELDDRAALEAQISENDKRADVSPVEQADGYLRLHTQHGVEVREIAARFGVRVAFVNERLAIARSCDEVRAALDEGRVRVGTAIELARLPSHEYQREAVKGLVSEPSWVPGGHTVAESRQWIRDRYHLRLAVAPFDTSDATLTAAGACDTCPKNTESQRELFGEEIASSAGQCTDPRCYSEKREAEWTRTTATARNTGRRVLSASESAAIVQGLTCARGYARADVPPEEHGGRKTWKQLLGAHYPEPVLARAPDGAVVEVLEPEALKAAVKAAGLSKKASKAKPEQVHDDVKKIVDEESVARIEAAAIEAVVTEARGACEDFDHELPRAWDYVAKIVCAFAGDEPVLRTLGELVGHDVMGADYERVLDEWLKDAAPVEIIEMITTVALRTAPEVDTTEQVFRAVRVALGINPVGIMESVREAAKKKATQKLVKLPKKGASKPVEERIEKPEDDDDEEPPPPWAWVAICWDDGTRLGRHEKRDMNDVGREQLRAEVEKLSKDPKCRVAIAMHHPAERDPSAASDEVARYERDRAAKKSSKKGGA